MNSKLRTTAHQQLRLRSGASNVTFTRSLDAECLKFYQIGDSMREQKEILKDAEPPTKLDGLVRKADKHDMDMLLLEVMLDIRALLSHKEKEYWFYQSGFE